MRWPGTILVVMAATASVLSAAAHAQVLKIVDVNAPAVNCVFQTDCIIPVTDTTGNILLPFTAVGTAWLRKHD